MKQLYTFLILAATALPLTSVASTAPAYTSPGFEENKGQVRDADGEATYVRYRMAQGDARIFLLEQGIAFQFDRLHYPDGYMDAKERAGNDPAEERAFNALQAQVRQESFRMDMTLEGADPNARISTSGRSHDHVHYYRYDALDVHSYEQVTYHEVYPGIDWVLRTTPQGMKYDFEVRPGADPELIRLVFTDHEELAVNNAGELVHGNRMGRFVEQRPVSFQNGKEVSTAFVLEGNTLRFALGDYDRTAALTIDPARIWGTFYGGANEDEAQSCTVDATGNVYMAGATYSSSGIASAGHQNTYGGGDYDAYLVKLNADGVRQWATYYGGADVDFGYGCAVDGSGNVYLTGNTLSTSGIADGGHQNTFGGGVTLYSGDAYLVKFNSDGVRQWGTYYGGANEDRGTACAVDGSGNVFMSGTTDSPTAIASGGHQNVFGEEDDAFLVKFDSDGMRQWGTYYGGDEDDPGWSCAVDASGNVYLAGVTSSATGIALNGHQNSLANYWGDAFLAKFDASGVLQWGTYYGGVDDEDDISCATDGTGNVFLAGSTTSTSGIAADGHQNTIGSDEDAFIAKFNSDGVRQWGTYFGGELYEEAGHCAADALGNVYLSGYTESTSAIASGGFQNTLNGYDDAFLAVFGPDGQRLWATYYGGSIYDSGSDCAVGGDGTVYLTGHTDSSEGIASGGHQNTEGGDRDAFLVKFDGLGTGIGIQGAIGNPLRWSGQQGDTHRVLTGDLRLKNVALYNVTGQRQHTSITTQAGSMLMDLSGHAPGVYFLHTEAGVVRLVHE